MSEVNGAQVVAKALKLEGIQHMFGIVGIPVTDIAVVSQTEGIHYYSMRNEQAASYAAGAAGFLTGIPGICLSVSGPGMIHCLAGLSNSWANAWPMVLLSGANDRIYNSLGAFQEATQVEAARPFVKFAARIESIARIPYYIHRAIRVAAFGRPGAVYLEFPGDIISATISESDLDKEFKLLRNSAPFDPERSIPRSLADPTAVSRAVDVLLNAKRPLVIVGKGAANSFRGKQPEELLRLLSVTGFPFLPTPMGKGLVSDLHESNVIANRTQALLKTDVVLLLGARLNWMLHFGQPPRWQENVKAIMVDVSPEEMAVNPQIAVGLVGDAREVVKQLLAEFEARKKGKASIDPWVKELQAGVKKNVAETERLSREEEPLGYYKALSAVRRKVREWEQKEKREVVIVSEGANTMDIGRTIFENTHGRTRLDAGTFGTMGVGMGFAVAAAAVGGPSAKVVAIEGDSAFGFSGMEVETMARYKMDVTIVIINNNGISMGVEDINVTPEPLPFVYTVNARYEKIAEVFGGRGWFVTKAEEIGPAVEAAMKFKGISIVNVMINPSSGRKAQQFGWHTRNEGEKSKL